MTRAIVTITTKNLSQVRRAMQKTVEQGYGVNGTELDQEYRKLFGKDSSKVEVLRSRTKRSSHDSR